MKFGAAIPIANEWHFLPAVAGQLLRVCDRVVVLRSQHSLSGAPMKLSPVPALLDHRIEIVDGDWAAEHETRNAGMQILKDCNYVFTVDTDEIMSDNALRVLTEKCRNDKPRALLGGCHTYWKTIEWRIDPPEKIIAPIVVRNDVRFSRLRMFLGEYTEVNTYVFHHLSYVRSDDEVREKMRLFGHASEVVPGWYDRVWKAWDQNHALENLHPTHPEAFKRAVPVTDSALRNILIAHGVA